MSPKITIGLPVWNAMPFLEDALRSVFAQSFSDWELVIVDDGSRDGGVELLRRLNEPRARVLSDGEHRGLGARLNQIVALASAPYIARMDADDLMHPERLARELFFLEQNPEVHVVGCGLISFDGQQPIGIRRFPREHEQITAEPLRGFKLAHASVLGRTEWWRRQRYNEGNRGCEDWQLWFESHRSSRFANIPDALYFYREQQAYSFRGYARDKAELATLLWQKRGELGMAAVRAAAAQWVRIGVYAGAHVLGLDQKLVLSRGGPVSTTQAEQFSAACAWLRGTTLPFAGC